MRIDVVVDVVTAMWVLETRNCLFEVFQLCLSSGNLFDRHRMANNKVEILNHCEKNCKSLESNH